MLHYVQGNLFESGAEWLVNPVNCKGVMGAGLALEFKKRFTSNFEAYRNYCRYQNLTVGDIYVTYDQTGVGVVNFPTKDDWRDPSKIEYISSGLESLKAAIVNNRIRSVAIPALGCGLGGLSWADVKEVIHAKLQDIAQHVDIFVYTPAT